MGCDVNTLTDTLRPILAAYRAEVQPHWSPATAHPDFDGKQGDPAGQCGVTSAWLQRRLAEDHGIETQYCTGRRYATPTDLGSPHCWLEWENSATVVFDLTADQFLGSPVVCGTYVDLARRERVLYVALHSFAAAELTADPVQARLAILTAEVGR